MGFEEFLPKIEEGEPEHIKQPVEKITQSHVYDVITSRKPDWQTIIYELINSEQLDPWDIDIITLTNKYFEKILALEQDPDFYSSSKVILAAALLLKIKSEFLLERHIRSIDEILFGKKEEPLKPLERIEIDESDLPLLIPKTPLPRLKKVTLAQLMEALNKAITTESRRIKREVQIKRARKLSEISIPKFRTIDLKDRIREFYARILTLLKQQTKKNITFADLTKNQKEQKLASFLPLLHLSNTKKLWLETENHLDDILIYLYTHFEKNRQDFIKELEEDIEAMKEELQAENGEESFDNKQSGLDIARAKQKEKKNFQDQIKKELELELGTKINELINEVAEIEQTEKIDDLTGFSDE